MDQLMEAYEARKCLLCGRELPRLRWYERGALGAILFGAPPLCSASRGMDIGECQRIFVKARTPRGEGA